MRVDLNQPAIRALLAGPQGPVAKDLARKAQKVTQGAKRRCPTSPAGSGGNRPGHLRSSISWDMGVDAEGLHADVGTDVSYAIFVEVGTKPHIIRSHGNWPLRSAKGQVFGRVVHHPGTRAQPYLRPSIDDLRGA
jgi:Bacteriophage HK97-gp10, putative tail-component